MSWRGRWMQACQMHAGWSKDPRRGVGAVIVNDRQVQVSGGWNGLPRGVDDRADRYHPDVKAKWCEHAERNAIYNAAAEGQATRGCTLYSSYFPCADCARAVIQSGITRVVTIEPDWTYPARASDWAVAYDMLTEAGVMLEYVASDTHALLQSSRCVVDATHAPATGLRTPCATSSTPSSTTTVGS